MDSDPIAGFINIPGVKWQSGLDVGIKSAISTQHSFAGSFKWHTPSHGATLMAIGSRLRVATPCWDANTVTRLVHCSAGILIGQMASLQSNIFSCLSFCRRCQFRHNAKDRLQRFRQFCGPGVSVDLILRIAAFSSILWTVTTF